MVGSVVAIGGPAIGIATAGVMVKLRNLVIVPLPGGSATDAIPMTNGALLAVNDCLLEILPGSAIVANTAASVRDCSIVRNGSEAVAARSDGLGAVSLAVSNSMIANNGTGFFNEVATPGTFESAGNNALRNNTTPKTGTVSVVTPLE